MGLPNIWLVYFMDSSHLEMDDDWGLSEHLHGGIGMNFGDFPGKSHQNGDLRKDIHSFWSYLSLLVDSKLSNYQRVTINSQTGDGEWSIQMVVNVYSLLLKPWSM